MLCINTSLGGFLTVFIKTSKIYKHIFRITLLAYVEIHGCQLWRRVTAPLKAMIFGGEWCIRSGERPGKEVTFQSHLGPLFPASPSRNSFNLWAEGSRWGSVLPAYSPEVSGSTP